MLAALIVLAALSQPAAASLPELPTPVPPEKMPRNLTPPLPESELTHIVIPASWLLEKDEDERPDVVRITFPVSWINKPPNFEIDDNESIAYLRCPKELLKVMDTNEDPNLITVSLPLDMHILMIFSNVSEFRSSLLDWTNASGKIRNDKFKPGESEFTPEADPVEYWERIWYDATRTDVVGATGVTDLYSYYNSGETFRSYHEREIPFNGDGIEIVTDYIDNGNVYV